MYGRVGAGNVWRHGTYGSRGRRRYACKVCGKTWSETRGTALYNLRTDMNTILRALAMLVERGSIRGTARAMGVKEDTVSRWLERASKHSEEVSRHLMGNLNLTQVQVDEIWSFIKKKEGNLTREEREDGSCGDSWTWAALEAETKLLLGFQEGGWTTEDLEKLVRRVKGMSDGRIPLFTSDEIDQLEESLLRVYGQWETPEYKGRGRPPKPRLVPPPDLVYVQLIKERKDNRVVRVHKRVVFGEEVLAQAQANTSYVERSNLTVRQSVSRFVRRTLSFSKHREQHRSHLSLYQAWYNFVKPTRA